MSTSTGTLSPLGPQEIGLVRPQTQLVPITTSNWPQMTHQPFYCKVPSARRPATTGSVICFLIITESDLCNCLVEGIHPQGTICSRLRRLLTEKPLVQCVLMYVLQIVVQQSPRPYIPQDRRGNTDCVVSRLKY